MKAIRVTGVISNLVPSIARFLGFAGLRPRWAKYGDSPPDKVLNEEVPSPFGPGPLATSEPNHFLTFAFLARAADP
jgi:hypothetical protein